MASIVALGASDGVAKGVEFVKEHPTEVATGVAGVVGIGVGYTMIWIIGTIAVIVFIGLLLFVVIYGFAGYRTFADRMPEGSFMKKHTIAYRGV